MMRGFTRGLSPSGFALYFRWLGALHRRLYISDLLFSWFQGPWGKCVGSPLYEVTQFPSQRSAQPDVGRLVHA